MKGNTTALDNEVLYENIDRVNCRYMNSAEHRSHVRIDLI